MKIQSVDILILAVGIFFVSCNRSTSVEPTPPPVVRPQAIRPVAELVELEGSQGGLRQATLFSHALPQNKTNIEIRTIVVRHGPGTVLVAENDGVMELRTGQIDTTINEEKQRRNPGDMWQVQKGSKQTIQVLGELASVRAIYLVPK